MIGPGRFCVNVLAEEQDQVAMVFAGMAARTSTASRRANGHARDRRSCAAGAAASFDCMLGEVVDQSTHAVLFGDVVATAHRTGQDTLLYGARRFRQLRKIFTAMGAGAEEYL